jgi:hypothetical protein
MACSAGPTYDWTILLPSKVFEAEDSGRSYRLRPRTRSIWLRDAHMAAPDGAGVAASYIVPDGPGLAEAIRGSPARPVKSSTPEQYYYTLTACVDRFRPDFVVVSVYANDFGNALKVVSEGVGDRAESRYWLEKITEVCRARRCSFLLVPVPIRASLVDRRTSGNYPAQLFNVLDIPSSSVLDPFDDFVGAYLEWLADGRRKGWDPSPACPLFNDAIEDEPFTPEGARVWARSVGERVIQLLNYARADRSA